MTDLLRSVLSTSPEGRVHRSAGYAYVAPRPHSVSPATRSEWTGDGVQDSGSTVHSDAYYSAVGVYTVRKGNGWFTHAPTAFNSVVERIVGDGT